MDLQVRLRPSTQSHHPIGRALWLVGLEDQILLLKLVPSKHG